MEDTELIDTCLYENINNLYILTIISTSIAFNTRYTILIMR